MNFKKQELVNIGLNEDEVKEILITNKALEIKDFKNEKDIILFNGVDGRNFHNVMKIGTDYTTWIKRRVESYNFKENIDFVTFVRTEKGENGYKTFTEYYLSTNMAKELEMIENNEMGKITEKENTSNAKAVQLRLQFEQLQHAVFAKMVQKVGDRVYWEKWAKEVSTIAQRQIERINRLINEGTEHKETFQNFISGLKKNINPSISEQEAVEMLSQHMITKPVFEALFEGYSFVKNNPISTSMQTMIDLLEAQGIEKDTETLDKFYDSVRKKAKDIDNAEGKQKIIIELYDKFFKTAFPKMVEKLGIVYTPVEVIDFIIHSVNDILKKEFGRNLSDENIHILDPFTGTGTFITRLLQSGLIDKKDLQRKYQKEIHANEIVLLAYYIAAINIENAYHDIIEQDQYEAFEGICLTDTFQIGETEESERLFSSIFPENSNRVLKQKKDPLRVIIGNPPYSIGQKSANDNAQNQDYPKLNGRIENTYVKESRAGLNKSLYDSYIKAFRWSTDRLDKNGGIICFVSNGAWIDGNSQDGFRKHLEKEFSSIYVFNLRGNQRTSGELSRKEGGKIFGPGSRTPISITLLVKRPDKKNKKAEINYCDIGDYLSREEKLGIVKKYKSVSNIEWNTINPNEQGDWINHRTNLFETFIPIQPEKKFDLKCQTIFNTYVIGIATNRDNWVYNFSMQEVTNNMKRMIEFYNNQTTDYIEKLKEKPDLAVEDFIEKDPVKISWTVNLKNDIKKQTNHNFKNSEIKKGLYRPFCKQVLYFDKSFIERPGLNKMIFPNDGVKNLIICCHGLGGNKPASVIITDKIVDLNCLEAGSQCFPLYYYEEQKQAENTLFSLNETTKEKYIRKDGISDFIIKRTHEQYGKNVKKEDIFYYVYGILHSPEYSEQFANDLKKMLPRIPLVDEVNDFWKFSRAGRELAELHINYESVPAYGDITITGIDSGFYTVEKMRFPKKDQKDTIIYNSKITIENIPDKAYEYVVNGKSAIEWIIERYQVKIDKDNGIKNDPNDWAKETEKPRYILDLLLSIINISVKTVEIIYNLPKLKLDNEVYQEMQNKELLANSEDKVFNKKFNIGGEQKLMQMT